MGLLDEITNSINTLSDSAVKVDTAVRKITSPTGISTPQTTAPAQTLPSAPAPTDTIKQFDAFGFLQSYGLWIAGGLGILLVGKILLRRGRK